MNKCKKNETKTELRQGHSSNDVFNAKRSSTRAVFRVLLGIIPLTSLSLSLSTLHLKKGSSKKQARAALASRCCFARVTTQMPEKKEESESISKNMKSE